MYRVIVLGNSQRVATGWEVNANLIHRLLVLEFAVTLGTFNAMFCIVVLSSCQQVTVERLDMNLVHRLLSLELAIALRALYRAVGFIAVLSEIASALVEEPLKRMDLITSCLCRKFLITIGTFEAVFRVIVLREDQWGVTGAKTNGDIFHRML